jgi:PRC-barrel domain
MKKLLVSTAIVLAMAGPSMAQTASPYVEGVQDGVRASSFIGKRVYITEADTAGMSETAMADADANWQDAGEIGDLILSRTGDAEVVLVDFGGFLGIGEKSVAVNLTELVMVPDADSPQDYFIVFKGTKADLESAPAFNADMVFTADDPAADGMATDGTAADGMAADGTVATDGTAPAADGMAADDTVVAEGTAPATDDTMATEDMAATTPMAGEVVDLASWAEADLVGKRVYGSNDEDIGEISAVALTADGKVDGAVVDVGGFLGVGEKRVSLTSEMLTMVTPADGSAPFFRVAATQEELEALTPYTN